MKLHVTPFDVPDRRQAVALAEGIGHAVVGLFEARHGFVSRPRRGVVKHFFGWAAGFRRLAKGCARWCERFEEMNDLALGLIWLPKAAPVWVRSR